MWSGKCPVGEMSVRGNVLVGKCPVGEVSFGEVSGRGIVRSGKFPSGRCPLGKCQSGNCPRGSASRGNVHSGNCPHIQSDTPMEIIGNSRQHGLGISSYSPELGLKGLAIKVLTTVNHNHKLKNMKKIA